MNENRRPNVTAIWTIARQELDSRRADRAARARLAAEIADYRTDADRNDLNALLDQYSDTDAAPVRELLNR